MKSFTFLLILGITCSVPCLSQNDQDLTHIQSVTKEYLTAWYQADEQLMEKVVHPQMAKKIVFDAGNNQGALAYLSAEDLIAQTRRKRAQVVNVDDLKANITVLDVYNNSAMVKAETENWIDYLHMAKISGEWKIVNILWELKYGGF